MRALAERGVGAQVHYVPLHHQPFYKNIPHAGLPGADAYYASTLSIPMHMKMDDAAVEIIVQEIQSVLKNGN